MDAKTFVQEIHDAIAVAVAQQGFPATLKALNKGRLPLREKRSASSVGMMTVLDGVIEELPSGLLDAAIQTDRGPVVLRGAQPTDRYSDPQLFDVTASPASDVVPDATELSSGELLRQLSEDGLNSPCELLLAVELNRFESSQHEVLLPLLWRYILAHRNSNDRTELVATGAAIRKYIAIMPMDRMGELAVLLESGHRSPLPIDLEIEVAKMVVRNFEVHPPVEGDPHPDLALRLWEMVQAYTNPRILLRDKHSAAASLAIEAIIAMRSSLADKAWQVVAQCPYQWFTELVSDDLDDLHEKWSRKSAAAAVWLDNLRSQVVSEA
ncbi:MAG: hypothetical protein KDA55_01470 [Planctomycetales bacterium]|nr:hypothetical protein [Planctomycetales bacterium]